ncbi:RNA polymerase II transcription initiation/nucleotide excision repair factor TFIIH, subunit TFB2 [Pseudoloma neurophilia]|uniref:RNA polymerase II transcription factor B subunit 2 n=1 Tax=Pseudoloma neurophilia TaxID=146866 RepID=A0A0R0M1F3_9MICR|nr:RNA polymerase II transcription initiation/nucleotide excision repair factor TFIIH, subunit TFB2 [Pseudoloma neurophilia]
MVSSSLILQTLAKYKDLRSDPLFTSVLLKLINVSERETLFTILLKEKLTLSDNLDREALRTLNSLNLLTIDNDRIILDENFRSSFFIALKTVRPSGYLISDTKINVSTKLPSYSPKFNHILSILVNEHLINDHQRNNYLIKNILIFAGLKDINITHSGFAFLLESKREQLSHFLLSGIDKIVEGNEDQKMHLLLLLFDMGNYGTGSTVSVKINLQAPQNSKILSLIDSFLELLNLIGAISFGGLQPKKGDFFDHSFYITPIYYTIFNSEESVERFLILETNYKLYSTDISAHTRSVLSLFSNILCTLPNLIMCSIDENSINRALSKGITGQQICDYITNRSTKDVNEIVLEQIIIWEKNRNRIFKTPAILYDHFESFNEFQIVLTFCQDFMLCCDKERRVIVVKEEDHQRVKIFIRENIKR